MVAADAAGVWGRRLRARDGEFRAPARVTFFFCKKKVTKENHSNLRFKDPLARGGQVRIWRCVLAHEVRWVTLSVQRTACTSCAAAADSSEGRGWCADRVAIIKSRQSRPEGGFGWWRLTPPGYGGTCLPAGRSVRGSDRPPACHSTPRTPQGEGFGRYAARGEGLTLRRDEKKREPPCGRLPFFLQRFLVVQVRPVRDRSDRAA